MKRVAFWLCASRLSYRRGESGDGPSVNSCNKQMVKVRRHVSLSGLGRRMCGIGLVWHGSNSCDETDQETFKVVPVDTGQMCREGQGGVLFLPLTLPGNKVDRPIMIKVKRPVKGKKNSPS